uniref:Uncharacterized protein n=1 Tax=Naja naja TaxID=35670 RepID=A0A8C6XLF6_NAJNA
ARSEEEEEEEGGRCLGRPPSLQMFAGMSSLHGVRRIFAAGSLSLRRAAWALLFVGSLALLALASAERVGYFLAFPRVTRVDETAAPNLTFPAVTLCNLNAFRLSKLTRNDLYHAGRLLALLGADGPRRAPLGGPESLAALRDKADFQGFKARPFDMAEFYNRTGHDLPEMLWRCAFRGVACSARNFTLVRGSRPGEGTEGGEGEGMEGGFGWKAVSAPWKGSCRASSPTPSPLLVHSPFPPLLTERPIHGWTRSRSRRGMQRATCGSRATGCLPWD